MKVSVEVNEAVIINANSPGEFKIKNSARAFQILSSGLYQNKIKAIIRELSCNALDSHVAAGKAHISFVVHLPTMLEPWFSVQDYGLGLDDYEIKEIYTTYFESSKTNSNDYIGALGLGSKSPFSYTENFIVTAIKNGTKRIYSAFINEYGVPGIAEMVSEQTSEQNGVEVKFSVTDRHEFNSFKFEAQNVFTWFKNKPTIIGNTCELSDPVYLEQNIAPNVHRLKSGASIALMGNIAYPIDISEPKKHFGELAPLLSYGFVMQFNIGDLDFTASREGLSYIGLTINSIKSKLEQISENLVKYVAKEADLIQDEWLKAEFLQEKFNISLYKTAVAQYVTNTNFLLFDVKDYYGKKIFSFTDTDIKARNLSISSSSCYNGRVRLSYAKAGLNFKSTIEDFRIPVDSTVIFVLNDLKSGCMARVRYHFSRVDKNNTVICLEHSSKDISIRHVEYNKLLKELHDPPRVVLASSLSKKVVIKREVLSNKGIDCLIAESVYGGNNKSKWKPYTDPLTEDSIYYFVCLNNNKPETLDGKYFGMEDIYSLMINCGIPNISNIKVFGVKKSRIKEIKSLKNWMWIEDKLKEEINKISDESITNVVAKNLLSKSAHTPYVNSVVASKLPKNSSYVEYFSWYNSMPIGAGSISHISSLCKLYSKTLQTDAITKKVEDRKAAIISKYPLLNYFSYSSVPIEDIVSYVKLVDNQVDNKS